MSGSALFHECIHNKRPCLKVLSTQIEQMKYNLKTTGKTRILHIELPKISLENSIFVLMIKDLTGKLMFLLEEITLPNDIKLEDLNPGKYVLTLVSDEHYFSELITT